MNIKLIFILGCLAIQTACLNIALTWSRTPDRRGRTYNIPLAIFAQELVKAIFAYAIACCTAYMGNRKLRSIEIEEDMSTEEAKLLNQDDSFDDRGLRASFAESIRQTNDDVFSRDMLRLSLPAILYVAQNCLLFTAASSLPATTYAVLVQLKILTTAAFTVTFLKRSLNVQQWLSLLCLFAGVSLFQVSKSAGSREGLSANLIAATRGIAAILLACTVSGFAGVYTEKILHRSEKSIFVVSSQIALCSLVPAGIPVASTVIRSVFQGQTVSAAICDIFTSFGIKAWTAISLSVWGGFMVALSVKYSSSIAKGFATSLAVLLTFPFAIVFLGERITALQILGGLLVVSSIVSYSLAKQVDNTKQRKELNEVMVVR